MKKVAGAGKSSSGCRFLKGDVQMRKDTRTAGKDLTGQRFGHLTVIEKTGQTENKYRLWLCRCDCGKEIAVNTKRL